MASRVDHEVDQNLLHLRPVCQHGREPGHTSVTSVTSSPINRSSMLFVSSTS
jgi:hypothetical protein